MKWLNIVRARLRALVRSEAVLDDIEEEMRSHLEMQTQTNLERGMTPDEARASALRSFGHLGRMTELAYDVRGGGFLEAVCQDLRFGMRMLAKNPGFTAVAVLTIALGIGANTAIFSLIDAVLLKMLPVEQPDQLYFIDNVGARGGGGAPPYPCFERFRDQSRSFTGIAAFVLRDLRIRIDGQREEVTGQFVSGNYFSLLGISPVLGRTFTPADDLVPEKGGPEGLVAVISYRYWTRRFGRDRTTVGKVVEIGNDSVTIVGVTPPEFYGLFPGTEIDISLTMMMEGAPLLRATSTWWFSAVGRLGPNASLGQARAELNAIFEPFMDETGVSAEARREAFARIELTPASKGLDTLRRQFSRPLAALMVIVALVLLIACANVANLLLGRAAGRGREFALRLALGASRSRLLLQMLTESLLLASLGALLGLLFARWGVAFLTSFFATGRDRLFVNPVLDYRVLVFTAGVASLTGLMFGVVPALRATRIDPAPRLKDGINTVASSSWRFGKALVVAQFGLSLLLLVGAGLFLQTLRNLKKADAGFDRTGVVTMRVNPAVTVYGGPRLGDLWKDILARVQRLPGVRSASLSTLSPLGGIDSLENVEVAGFTPGTPRDNEIRLNQVSSGFFRAFRIGLLQGRTFTDADNETAGRVALLNETAARFYFGQRSAIGAQLSFNRRPNAPPSRYRVVGVVRDSRYSSLREPDTRLVYLPMLQPLDQLGRLTLTVQAAADPAGITGAVLRELRAAGPDILVTDVATLDEQIDRSLLQERLVATLSLFFGAVATLLACVGLYGVMSYAVTRRTNEIGVRMALGAGACSVMRLVIGEVSLLVILGAAIGLAAARATTGLVANLLYGVAPADPVIIALATAIMIFVAILAAYVPARRATKVDPLIALRYE